MPLPRLRQRHGWAVWAAFTAVLVALLWLQPGQRILSSGYFDVARRWWDGRGDIYDGGIAGFLYLPQSVWAFTPFTWLDENLANAAWRILGVGLLAWAFVRLARARACERADEVFALATMLALSAAGASARTGQSNLHLAACLLHAGLDLAQGRHVRSSIWLWAGMAAKPLAFVMILLCAALSRPMRKPLAIGLVVFAVLPLLHPDPAWAWRQYGLAFEKIARSSQPGDKVYADIVGLLRWLGWDLPGQARMLLQGAAGLAILALSWRAWRRLGEAGGSLAMTALAACYLVLFNPRTETNSYVILIPHVAVAAAHAWLPGRRPWLGVLLVLACVALGCDNYGRPFHQATSPWLKPAVALAYLLYLSAGLLVGSPRSGGPGTRERGPDALNSS